MSEQREHSAGELARTLERWVGASLITRDQAEAIRSFEGRHAAAEGRVPLIAEALGYLGAALALAAGIAALGQEWNRLSGAARLGALGGGTAVLLVGGSFARSKEEPAIVRLGSVLWFLSAMVGLWFAATLLDEAFSLTGEQQQLGTGIATALYAGILYLVRRRALQQAALAVGCVTAFVSLGDIVSPIPQSPWEIEQWIGPSLWLLGVVWIALAWSGVLVPRRTGYGIGAAIALVGPFLRGEALLDLGVALGIGTAVALLAASVRLRETVLLGAGAVGLFAHLVVALGEYFGDTIGMPLVLLASGVLLIAIALASLRLRRFTGPPTPRHT